MPDNDSPVVGPLELLAERISEYRVCLLGIEEELLEAVQQLAQETTDAKALTLTPTGELQSGEDAAAGR